MKIWKKVVFGALTGLGVTLAAHAYGPGNPASLTAVPQGFAECAVDGGVCKVPPGATAYVVYGINGKYLTSQGTGDFTCLPKGWVPTPTPAKPQDLGIPDPVPNVQKKCYLQVAAAAPAAAQGAKACYWMSNTPGNPWIKNGGMPAKTEAECMKLDSCSPTGGKASGGGCYKWATDAEMAPAHAPGPQAAPGKPHPAQSCLQEIARERQNFVAQVQRGIQAKRIDEKERAELEKVHNELMAMEKKAFEDHKVTPQECGEIHKKVLEENAKLQKALSTPVAPTIKVQHAEYGQNCAGKGKPDPNIKGTDPTKHIAAACDGKGSCDYKVDHTVIGDPVFGCRKEYVVQYHCGTGQPKKASVAAEATGQMAKLDCTK